MRLSTRSRYGVRLMLELALHTDREPVFLKDIARKEEISLKYLSQIVIPLKANGLINTFRGAHGGYVLNRPASSIKLREIVEPLEGDLCMVACVNNTSVCERTAECVTRDVWSELGKVIIEFLDSISLNDLVLKYNTKNDTTEKNANYSI